jgi:hypothetical protein
VRTIRAPTAARPGYEENRASFPPYFPWYLRDGD